MELDRDLASVQEARNLLKAARAAQEALKEYSREQVDAIVKAMKEAGEAESCRLGALAVEDHLGVIVLPKWTGSFWLALAGVILGLQLNSPYQEFLVTCSFFFLLRWALSVEKQKGSNHSKPGRVLVWLGACSYSIYLVHEPLFVISKRLTVDLLPNLMVLALRPSIAILAGWCFYRLVELYWLKQSQKVKA